LEHFGAFWGILEHFGAFLEHFETFWGILAFWVTYLWGCFSIWILWVRLFQNPVGTWFIEVGPGFVVHVFSTQVAHC
jgi:hypothetical protein